jgi:hypothetical protein
MDRPQPRVAIPVFRGELVLPPNDVLHLFDGKSIRDWRSADSAAGPAKWKVENGYMEVVPGTGAIVSRWPLGDAHLHIEWMSPAPPSRQTGQNRGNSGVFLMRTYEVQVLDSYENPTYPDGQAGSVYGQYPPLVNASRKPGEWQSFDIIFHAPRFSGDSSVSSPARMTVFHNGVLVQDNVSLVGPTSNGWRAPYKRHEDWLPILLQDHGEPVRFRNIWARRIDDGSADGLEAGAREYLATLRNALEPLQGLLDDATRRVRADSGSARADSAVMQFRSEFSAAIDRLPAFRDPMFQMTAYPSGAAAQRYRRGRMNLYGDVRGSDREASDSLQALLRSFGVWPLFAEGDVYPQVSLPALRDRFRPFVTLAMRELLSMQAMDQAQPLWSDASLMTNWTDHAERLARTERFLQNHHAGIGQAEAQERGRILWGLYIHGADNTRAFDRGTGMLNVDLRRSYNAFIAKYGSTEYGSKLARYLEVLKANGYRRTPAVQAFQATITPGRR